MDICSVAESLDSQPVVDELTEASCMLLAAGSAKWLLTLLDLHNYITTADPQT